MKFPQIFIFEINYVKLKFQNTKKFTVLDTF